MILSCLKFKCVLLNGNAIEIYNKKHHKNLKNIGKF